MSPLSWSVRKVCSPRPSLPITMRQPDSPDGSRRDEREELGVQMAVEIGDDLADDVDLHALAAKGPDLRVDLARRLREFAD